MSTFLVGDHGAIFVTDASGSFALAPGFPVTDLTDLTQAVLAPFVTDNFEGFFPATVGASGALSLLPAQVASDDAFPLPTMLASVALSPALVSDADTVYAPGPSRTLLPQLLTALDSVFTASADRVKPPKESRLRPPRIEDDDFVETIYRPTRTSGPVNVAPSFVASDDVMPVADVGWKVLAEFTTDADAIYSDIDIDFVLFADVYDDEGSAQTYAFRLQQLEGGIPVPKREGLTGSIRPQRRVLTGSVSRRISLTGSVKRRGARVLTGSVSGATYGTEQETLTPPSRSPAPHRAVEKVAIERAIVLKERRHPGDQTGVRAHQGERESPQRRAVVGVAAAHQLRVRQLAVDLGTVPIVGAIAQHHLGSRAGIDRADRSRALVGRKDGMPAVLVIRHDGGVATARQT
jgi:hypothetical protein